MKRVRARVAAAAETDAALDSVPAADGPSADGRGPRPRIPDWAPVAAAYAAVLLTFLWARTLGGAYLVAALALILGAAGIAIGGARGGGTAARRYRVSLHAALVAAALAVLAGFATDRRLGDLARSWDGRVVEREARLAEALDGRMRAVVEDGRAAAAAATAAMTRPDLRSRFGHLADLRERAGVAALAVVDDAGELLVWSGEHLGSVPLDLRLSPAGITYFERPLASYLYFSAPINERGHRGLAAVLLETTLGSGDHATRDAAAEFASRRGARPNFAAGPAPDAAWSLEAEDRTIVHAHFERLSQAEWRAALADRGRRAATALGGAALLLLAVAALRRSGADGRLAARARTGVVLLAAASVALAAAPLGAVLGVEPLFSPGLFLLPLPGDVVLGTVIAVLLPLGALAAGVVPRPRPRAASALRLALATLAVAALFPAGLRLLLASAAPPLLEGGAYLWAGLLPAAVLLLTVPAVLLLPGATSGRLRPVFLGAGLAASLGLGLALGALWYPGIPLPAWLPALWAAPFALLGAGLAGHAGRGGRIVRWLAMGWLAATVALPTVWIAQVEATLRAGERELATLGTRADPFVDYLLRQFASEAAARHARGEDGMDLLYRSWVSSGLAREADPARVALWSPGRDSVEVEIVLGDREAMRRHELTPRQLEAIADRAWAAGQPVVEAAQEAGGAHVLAVPLDDGRTISVIVPPRRTLERSTALLPFLGAETRPEARLTLIPEALAHQPATEEVRWRRTEAGWRSEARVWFPEGPYHAHLDLRLPPATVRFARAVLLVALNLGFLALLWAVGRAIRGDPPEPPGGWVGWLGSFRARVTAALLLFFLLPTALFGAVAYRALAGEGARAARLVAERSVEQAVAAFEDSRGDLRALAARTGEEVLYYYRGELADASSPEAVRMGVYEGWMPAPVYLALYGGEELGAIEMRDLAQRRYVVAYRRLPPAGTLAVPVPLAAGDAAVRQRELADLILFAALLGGLLSLALSVAVGRALAGPIGRLRRAAGAVGAGRLGVRLPEDRADEFGEVFASFNRMVRRLRRARAREQRTARVLAWGEMARQIAHAIKNPLTPIKLSVQHVRRAYADRRPDFERILESNVEQALQEIDRLSELARAFSRYGAPVEAAGALEAVDVAAVVHEALTLYRAGDTSVDYREALEPDLPPAHARVGELKEVILNLLENARAALEDGGVIVVRAERARGGIGLVVRDDGQGIPPELLPRIFEPHFSTRSVGTGLGLAIVRRLVEGWGGTVGAESEPGAGATVRLWIPVAPDPERLAPPAPAGRVRSRGPASAGFDS